MPHNHFMKNTVLSSTIGVTLLGGGKVEPATLSHALTLAPHLVAADGAAQTALEYGYMPKAVIGDFDSLSSDMRKQMPSEILHHIAEQDSTDFEKCLSRVDAPLILGVGFMGARIDHELSVYNTLVRFPEKRCLIVGEYDICLHAPRQLRLELEVGTRVSLFPLKPVAGASSGLLWPIENIAFAPGGRIGTSNEASDKTVDLEFYDDGMLLILPRHTLPRLLDALNVRVD
ncbi:thiamine pyrophosphokinase [Pacificibacter marinus]|uniref:Thiamine diphosphokinase n=2 Tax=Pacificibacter marinus TaxID=658057 RepID=A0A1Y5SQD4_9RHOB|nr:thiamine pyrophosphokinase [Pacificibacter marinus]SLN46022.1 Thiamin pyrophosphokinase, catalytic domain [Pacificibacter marinus]